MRVSGAPLGVSGGEDGVDQDESADYLRPQPYSGAVSGREAVCAAAIFLVVWALQGLHKPHSTDGS